MNSDREATSGLKALTAVFRILQASRQQIDERKTTSALVYNRQSVNGFIGIPLYVTSLRPRRRNSFPRMFKSEIQGLGLGKGLCQGQGSDQDYGQGLGQGISVTVGFGLGDQCYGRVWVRGLGLGTYWTGTSVEKKIRRSPRLVRLSYYLRSDRAFDSVVVISECYDLFSPPSLHREFVHMFRTTTL